MPTTSDPGAVRTRDAQRSRDAILDAAETLFARDGYEAVSLAAIGDAAGLSRGTPSYFFGSKEELYVAVLERLYAARSAALQPAFAPLAAWADATRPEQPLRAVLTRSVEAYLRFLCERPAYVDLIEREALAGGDRLRALENQSTVMEETFGLLRRRARAHGLRSFDVDEVILTLVGLGYAPVALRHTMLRRQGTAIDDPGFIAKRRNHVVDVLLHLLVP